MVRGGRNRGLSPRSLSALAFCAICSLSGHYTQAATVEQELHAAARVAAHDAFVHAQAAYTNDPGSFEAAWQFGRACFDVAEFAESKREKAKVAELGITASKRAIELSSNCAAAHYYWGMNLGQIARTRGMAALSLVQELRRHFEDARKLDAKVDHAGPSRNLGYLYRDTPSLLSIGDSVKAKHYLAAAVELAPDFPENRLALMEGLAAWGDREEARQELAELEKLWPDARRDLAGPLWAVSWFDWEERMAKVRKKLQRR